MIISVMDEVGSIVIIMFVILGEALGAIGNPKVLDLLKHHAEDPVIEVFL